MLMLFGILDCNLGQLVASASPCRSLDLFPALFAHWASFIFSSDMSSFSCAGASLFKFPLRGVFMALRLSVVSFRSCEQGPADLLHF